jgi:SSS family solute:Na+ symporter
MNFTNLPSHDVQLNLGPFGTSTQSLTVIAIMVILLSLALFFTFVGGQISIIVTDFLQSMFVLFVMIGVIIAILYHYNWDFMAEGLKHASKPGESKYNPFDIGGNKDFNYFFWVIMFFNCVYQLGSWQGNQGHNVSAENPHEQKMAAIIGTIRSSLIVFGLTMVPIACLAVMHHPDSTAFAAEIKQGLEISFPGNPQMQQEQHTSMFLSKLLPIGLLGGFAAAMLAFFISTHNTYMHSWGSIFIQDVIMPFRKTAPSPEQHKRWLKMSILMVAVLIFSFSVLVPPNDYIFMFQQITGAIFLAGSGSLIIGGLYWKKGTTAGAWAAMISGAIISLSCIILRAIWSDIDALKSINDTFPLNGIEGGFLATVVGIFLYVTVSLLTKPKQDDILDKILHRGIYDESGEKEKLIEKKQGKKVAWYWRMMVVDPDVYTFHDKVIAIWVFFNSIALTMLPKAVILALVIAGFMSDDMWLSWWGYTLYQSMVLLTITAIWTSIGGFIDLKRMFKNLKEKVHSDDDNGRVEN